MDYYATIKHHFCKDYLVMSGTVLSSPFYLICGMQQDLDFLFKKQSYQKSNKYDSIDE